jgi:hypothetical protein
MKRAPVLACVLFLAALGCSTDQFRLQSDDEAKDKQAEKKPDVKTVGSVSAVWGANDIRVVGFGVVKGLQGTGGEPVPSEIRRQVMHDLKARGVEDPFQFLSTRDTAIVIVSAIIPPGTRKDDRVDCSVELIPEDKAISLRGGYLLECDLYEYTDASAIKQGASGTLKGKKVGVAEGPVITGLGDDAEKDRVRRGMVWAGAKSTIDRNFMLLINKDSQDARTVRTVSERINERFYGPFRGSVRGMAEARTTNAVTLKVPTHYKHNWPRFLRVVRHIPLRDSAASRGSYQRELAGQLLDPSTTVVAAIKLEALASSPDDVLEDFRRGLESPHPLVRFASAEALAYLGHPACGEPLAEIALKEPKLRAYALTALASLDEAVCVMKLRELLNAPSAETKYGAFRALSTLNPKDAAIPGEVINENFTLHQVAPSSLPLVHASTSRRAEIVLFGKGAQFTGPFGHQAGPEFLVTAAAGDDHCIVARISAKSGMRKEPCSLQVDEVIRKLGEMGATYPDVVELLLRSQKYKNVSCRVAVDALPQSASVYQLAYEGVRAKAQQQAEEAEEVELGTTPNLFALPGRRVRSSE